MNITDRLRDKNRDYAGNRPVTAVFLGDSVTHGCFEIYRGEAGEIGTQMDYEAVYHSQLKRRTAQAFPLAPLNIINAGVGGGNAPHGLARLERDVLSVNPDLVVVCFGLNDVCAGPEHTGQYVRALDGIWAALGDRGIQGLMLTPNMLNTYVSRALTEPDFRDIAAMTAGLQNEGVMDAYMDAARDSCRRAGVPVCDGYARWKALAAAGVDTTALLCNHINHPSREMHTLFADLLFEALLGL